MKIEREVLYSIVMKDGAKIEVSEAELIELYKELGKVVLPWTKLSVSKAEVATSKKNIFYDQGEY